MAVQHCRTCGADVVWIESPNGKPQIADAELTVEWVNDAGPFLGPKRIALIDSTGKVVSGYRCSMTDPDARKIEGHVSHWATCTSPPAKKGKP